MSKAFNPNPICAIISPKGKTMKRKIFALFALILTALTVPQSAQAVGNLTITPWRVVFGPRDRSASVELLNTSDTAGTYRIGWMITKATSEGKYEETMYHAEDDKDPNSVPHMVISSPRQVTIEPRGQQTIRLSLRRPANLPPGEYRAHITFIRMANPTLPEIHDPNAKTMSMELKVNYGFSIPVIVRQGEDKDLKVALSNPQLALQGRNTILKVDLNRIAGKFSSYGEIHAYWKPPKGNETEIGAVKNVALYPELKTRNIVIPLHTQDSLMGGKIRIAYIGKGEADGVKWDEKTFPIGGK